MNILGLQKLSLLDYPEKVACTIFTRGCNFRCPFCHNASLVLHNDAELIPTDEVFAFLKKRAGLLDGVCVSGGEPLLQADIEDFLQKVKALGYLIKLDTNGSFPEILKRLVQKKLVDYVAMDIKSSLLTYDRLTGIKTDLSAIKQSASFLMSKAVPFEFRTTTVKELHSIDDFRMIGEWLCGNENYYIQSFVDSGDVIKDGLSAFSPDEINSCLAQLSKNIPNAKPRGI
ncbi:MAG: anaerobic ribonucleoside-triphosphate reductase activating protein [Clostridia bacterium]